MSKEYLIKLLNGALDGHTRNATHAPEFCDGIKHVRELVDADLDETIHPDDLDEFCLGIICSVQPAEPQYNKLMTEIERGILAAAYFLYTAMHPFALEEA